MQVRSSKMNIFPVIKSGTEAGCAISRRELKTIVYKMAVLFSKERV
jgi:hypothetical protein